MHGYGSPTTSDVFGADYFVRRKLFVTLRFINRWKFWLSWCVPIMFLPVLSITHMTPEGRCGYILLVVGSFWMLNLIPLPISSLIPLFLCPMLGVLSSAEASLGFMKETSYLLFGGIAAAMAIEYSQLHIRVALRVLLTLGTQPRWLLLGIMISCGFLSMWINNTSTCALMLPIAEKVLSEMFPSSRELEAAGMFDPAKEEERQKERSTIRRMVLVSVCMSCNLGGTGTVTGTGPNVVLLGVLVKTFGYRYYISYLQWMEFAIPALIISMIITWIVLQIYFLGFKATFLKSVKSEAGERLSPILRIKYESLGRMSYHEAMVLILFGLLVILWMTRDPRLTPTWKFGWAFLFYEEKPIRDSAAAMLILVAMCMLPNVPIRLYHQLHDRALDEQAPAVLDWLLVQQKLGWGVLLIIGGGLTMSDACKDSGLTHWAATQLDIIRNEVSMQMLLLLCLLLVIVFTTVTSNAATAALIVPVMAPLGISWKVNPLYFMFPATIACSYSFILPVSTPPNSMVYERGGIEVMDMALPGTIVAIILVCLLMFWMEVYAPLIFEM